VSPSFDTNSSMAALGPSNNPKYGVSLSPDDNDSTDTTEPVLVILFGIMLIGLVGTSVYANRVFPRKHQRAPPSSTAEGSDRNLVDAIIARFLAPRRRRSRNSTWLAFGQSHSHYDVDVDDVDDDEEDAIFGHVEFNLNPHRIATLVGDLDLDTIIEESSVFSESL